VNNKLTNAKSILNWRSQRERQCKSCLWLSAGGCCTVGTNEFLFIFIHNNKWSRCQQRSTSLMALRFLSPTLFSLLSQKQAMVTPWPSQASAAVASFKAFAVPIGRLRNKRSAHCLKHLSRVIFSFSNLLALVFISFSLYLQRWKSWNKYLYRLGLFFL